METLTIAPVFAAGGGALGRVAVPLFVAFAVTAVATPVVRRIAIARNLYDRPDAGLKPHDRPIPYLGGVGIYLGWIAAVVGMAWLNAALSGPLLAVAIAGTMLMLTGMVDDIRHLRPRTRLALQAVAGGILLFGGVGQRIALTFAEPFLDNPSAALETHPATLAFSGMITVAILLSATNATHLIDGLDGLCAGVTAIAAIGCAVLAMAASIALDGRDEPVTAVMLSAALLGACLGFLLYNFNPATIFMGDSGSLLLGLNAAVLILILAESMIDRAGQSSFAWLAAAAMVFGFPVFDTALAIARRRRNRKPLFVGDRSHFYDQLRDRGFSVRRTVLTCYALALGFSVLGIAVIWLSAGVLLATYALIGGGAAVALFRAGMLRVDDAAGRSATAHPPREEQRPGTPENPVDPG